MNRGFAGLIAGAVVLILAALLFTLFGKEYRRNWGSTEAEVAMALPGDSLVPEPDIMTTRAITVHAPQSAVWPWLVQMGQRRGGFYTHSALENLAGLKMRNAWEIVPEWQRVEIGDPVFLAPGNGAMMRISELIPDSAIVLDLVTADSGNVMPDFRWSWAFVVLPDGEKKSRLVIRERIATEGAVEGVSGTAMDLTSWAMESGTLRGVKIRAERTAR